MEFLHKDLVDNLNISGIYWMFFPNKKYYFGSSKNIQETGMNLNSLYSKLSRPKSEKDKCWRYV